jgi:stage III sporulation protein AH
MMVLKKKTIIIVTLVLLIIAAGYISTKYGKAIDVGSDNEDEQADVIDDEDATTSAGQASSGYFVDVKLGRENQRIVDKQTLQEIIDNKNSSKDAKKKAEEKLFGLVDASQKEMVIEALVKAKGFEDVVVFLQDSTANVTVKAKDIKSDQVNMVKNIVCKETGLPAAKVMVQAME